MLEFIDYVVGKLLILPAMETVPGGSTRLIEGTRGVVHSTFRGLVKRAVESGELRASTDPDDLFRAFVGVFHTTSQPGWESSARRIVDILIEGSRRSDYYREMRFSEQHVDWKSHLIGWLLAPQLHLLEG